MTVLSDPRAPDGPTPQDAGRWPLTQHLDACLGDPTEAAEPLSYATAPGGAPVESLEPTRGHSVCSAAACALGPWRHNSCLTPGQPGPAGRYGLLEGVLDRLLSRLEEAVPGCTGPLLRSRSIREAEEEVREPLYERLRERMAEQYAAGELFSLLPCRTAEGPPC